MDSSSLLIELLGLLAGAKMTWLAIRGLNRNEHLAIRAQSQIEPNPLSSLEW